MWRNRQTRFSLFFHQKNFICDNVREILFLSLDANNRLPKGLPLTCFARLSMLKGAIIESNAAILGFASSITFIVALSRASPVLYLLLLLPIPLYAPETLATINVNSVLLIWLPTDKVSFAYRPGRQVSY